MTTTYRDAAERLWGEAGAYIHDAYARFHPLFPELPEELPMVIGITAYGKCVGATLPVDWAETPRITIASNLFADGHRSVDDTVLHEMIHVHLMVQGKNPEHKNQPWYSEVERLAPEMLGRELQLRRGGDRRSVREENPRWTEGSDLPKTVVRKVPVEVEHPHSKVAGFPRSFRPSGYDFGEPIEVPTY